MASLAYPETSTRVKPIGVDTLKNHLAECRQRAHANGRIPITYRGTTVAVLMPGHQAEKLQAKRVLDWTTRYFRAHIPTAWTVIHNQEADIIYVSWGCLNREVALVSPKLAALTKAHNSESIEMDA